ncbi:hypothetical protein [Mediterraneibacter agrestimuris]|uniref:hypothetical protein n=1 Tax=Mediterraneibacter agrestimuris TaxID=2941333 RepID=UPI00204106E6|nr:hypothetical protein [Mediterraneibacter agrestimuris]
MKNKKKIGLSIAGTLAAVTIVSVAIHFHYAKNNETVNVESDYIKEAELQRIDTNEAGDIRVQGDGNNTQVINNQVINNYYNDLDKVVPEDAKSSDEDSDVGFVTETHVRLADDEDRTWYKSVSAKVGDKVEFRIEYRNTSDKQQDGVAIRDVLFTNNLSYVDGSTVLKNSNHPDGAYILNDALVENGIRIGNYGSGANALIYFTADVVDEDLEVGTNTLANWGQAGVGEITIQNHADVVVNIPKE